MAGKKSAAPNGVELGVGYVSLTTDTAKLGQEIEEELGTAGSRGGKKAGDNASSELKTRLSDGVKTAGVAAGAAAAGGLAVGLSNAMERADLPGTIQAQLGTTPQFAKEIADAAGGAFASGWGDSLQEVGNTAGVLGQVLNELGDAGDIEQLTIKSTALAQQFDQDAAALANSAAQMVRTGMAGSVDEAFDVLTKGFQTNSKLSEDFVDSIDEYAVQFSSLGLNGAEGLNIMTQAMGAGARNGDLVADTLKEFVILTKEMPKATGEAYEAIGLDAGKMQKAIAEGGPAAKEAFGQVMEALKKVEDPAARSAAAVGIFGTKAEDMQGALFAIDPAGATQGLGELAGTADTFVTNSMGMEQQLGAIGRTLTEGLGTALAPLLPQLQELATGGLAFFRWLAENPMVTSVLLGVAGAIAAIAAAQWIWNAAQLANPMTWIILGIIAGVALLVLGIMWLADNWDGAMKAMGHGINGLIHGVNGFIHGLNGVARAIEFILTAGGALGDWGWGEIPTIGLIPGLQTGGTVTGSGSVLVGEAGPEILQLPRGASVIPLDHPAANLPGGSGGGNTINLTTINPVAEKTSVTVRKSGQLLGASLV